MFVKCNDNFAIAFAFEVIFARQLSLDTVIVIKFTVYNGMNVIFAVMEWLVSGGTQVDN